MAAFPQKWTDEQVLAIIRASHADYPAVAESMGMSPTYARKYRESGSRRGNALRQAHGLPRLNARRAAVMPSRSDELRMIARIAAGDE